MSLEKEVRDVIAALHLVSHVSAANLGSSARDSGESIGGKRPPGGIDREGDREREWPMKSAEHFERRLAKAYSQRALTEILADATRSLDAWKRQPAPTKSNEPKLSSPQWKQYISESIESHGALAGRFGVTRAYIQEIRKKYGDAREVAA